MDKSDLQEILKRIDEKFEEADKRIDARFKGVDARFEETNRGIDAKFLDFYHNLIEPNFKRIDAKLSEHDGKFNEVLGHLDGIWKKLETLDQEYHAIVRGLNRLEENFEKHTKDKDALERELMTIKGQVLNLQSKIENLENRLKAA